MKGQRPAIATREVAIVLAVQAGLLVAMSPFYGPHRDELYFASGGQRLAWGYPDQPWFTPTLARLASDVAPHNLVVLRLPSLLAMVGLVLLAVHFSRLLGGGRSAQVLTAVVVAGSAVVMTLGHLLSTATFDMLAWTAVLVLVAQALVDDRPRLWLAAGLVAGIGLSNKHSVAFLLAAVLIAVAVDPLSRPVLRSRWPWLAGLLAMAVWAPNLTWQAGHDWPVFALSADIADEYGGVGGRLAMTGEAMLMFSPLIFVVWLVGLIKLLHNDEWMRARPVATAFLVVTTIFLVTGGKGYYLAGAIVPLIAAGCTWIVRSRSTRQVFTVGVVLVLSAAVAWPALVPVLPARTYTSSFYASLEEDQLETIGWPEYADQVKAVVDALPAGQRSTAVVFTGNYGEAGAVEWYDVGVPVYSGHNGWRNWGPPPDTALPVIVVLPDPAIDFTGCERMATLTNDVGANNEEFGNGVWLCDEPKGSWSTRWSALSHYDA